MASTSNARRAIEAVWRIESPKVIASVARLTGDVALAEDLAQDALVAALEQWESGVPDNPGAWLTTVAKRRAIDHIRRNETLARTLPALAPEERDEMPDIDEDIGDDMLRLVFIACHPVLSPDARAALTLRMLGGLTTAEIARAYLVPESSISQRIVRAKRTLSEANIPFELPPPSERTARLNSVLEVLYLIFNEGYAATAGSQWTRPELCEDALRLARVLAGLMPGEAEVHGLLALMEIQASRLRARVGADGAPVLLLDQDRTRWDHLAIARGLAALERARTLGGEYGAYALQAAIAAVHARARTAEDTDWERMVSLYDALAQLYPSPVVELNRAVAVGMARGPQAGLDAVDAIDADTLGRYHLLPGVRGDLLLKLGRKEEARAEFERAASLTGNERERAILLERAASCESSS